MKPLIVDEEAATDIENAIVWYEQQQPGLGRRFDAAIAACLSTVETYPKPFFTVEKFGLQRVLLEAFPYAVFFREAASVVVVLAVIHTSRDAGKVLRRRLRGQE